MKSNILRAFCLLFAVCMAASACDSSPSIEEGAAQAPVLTVLAIGTADSGGTMYPVGSAIAQAVTACDNDIKINVSSSSGSMMNVRALAAGEIDLGLVSGDVAYAAANGKDEFTEPVQGLRAIAAIYPSVSNWIAPRSLGAAYVHDLQGGHIGVGPQGSTTELSARIAIETLGLAQSGILLDNCSLSTGAQKVIDGQLDALHAFTGVPVVGLSDLANALSCRVLKYTDDELDLILAQNVFYYKTSIPKGTYAGQMEDVSTFGVKCLLCVDESMEEELVYSITQALWDSRAALQKTHASMSSMEKEGFMYNRLPIPLHKGALRFYQDSGLLASACPE